MRILPLAAVFAAAVLFAVPGSAPAAGVNVGNIAKATSHLDHMHLAAHALKNAQHALGGKGGNAHQHLSEAVSHIEHAISHHKTAELNQPRSGLTGLVATVAHHQHHGQLHEALHAAKEAQKHLASGKTGEAKHETEKAHHHIELAIVEHSALTGK